MKIDAAAIRNIMQIVHGKYTVNSREAEALSKLLSSREEFLAWLLLRNRYAALHTEVGTALVDAASSTVVIPMSRCKESNFPVFAQQEILSMEMAMRSLVEANKTTLDAADEINKMVNHFISRDRSDA